MYKNKLLGRVIHLVVLVTAFLPLRLFAPEAPMSQSSQTLYRNMNRAIRNTSLYLMVLMLLQTALLVTGCTGDSDFSLRGLSNSNSLTEVSVEAMEGSNHSMPVALDLLFINDSKLMTDLASLSSPEWFARKPELMMRYQQQIILTSIEVVPLSEIPLLELPNGHKDAKHVVMFANYIEEEGQYAVELSRYEKLKIRLEIDRYQLSEMKK
jgi:type VI secretion system protein